MGCLLALVALISPRLALFLLWIFSDLLRPRVRQLDHPAAGLLPAPVDDAGLRGLLGLGAGPRGDRL
jgi:hypothetical protein